MTMPIPVTGLYASLTFLLVGCLGANVSRMRGVTKAAFTTSPLPEAAFRAQRAHGNATEWVPLLVIMLGVLELSGLSSMTLHLLGGTVFFARVLHAAGVLMKKPVSVVGATLTYALAVGMPITGLVLHFR
jgi:hypothetical protein